MHSELPGSKQESGNKTTLSSEHSMLHQHGNFHYLLVMTCLQSLGDKGEIKKEKYPTCYEFQPFRATCHSDRLQSRKIPCVAHVPVAALLVLLPAQSAVETQPCDSSSIFPVKKRVSLHTPNQLSEADVLMHKCSNGLRTGCLGSGSSCWWSLGDAGPALGTKGGKTSWVWGEHTDSALQSQGVCTRTAFTPALSGWVL